MKKTILVIVFLCFLSYSSAQQILRTELGNVFYGTNKYKTEYNSPEGTPYLNESFTPAKINDISKTHFVRFNGYSGEVEVKVSEGRVVVLNEGDFFAIKLLDGSNTEYQTLSYLDEKGKRKHSFFQLLSNSEGYKLYLKQKVNYYKEVKAEAYKEAQPPRFKPGKPEFYFSTANDPKELTLIPQKTNGFLKLFPEKSQELKKFIKSKKLKLNRKEDLMSIFEYLKT
ncbi:hypothetical protein [Poritiphilus flavus]|uniref:Uncharacterized protein n=1 Tax=Poritiphilus flavus TaxID=2697053 RepID=A0A6L9EBH2_9FLAO|nr:hypothetical protein [Poritiphilus flavus]NAS12044.1 hypothetical protein [Poritiphilus flavus]